MHAEGKPLRVIEREYGMDRKCVREWIRRYNLYGSEGLDRKPHAKTTYEVRCDAVRCVLEEGRPYREMVEKHNVSRCLLKKLIAKTKAGGYEALHLQRQRHAD